MKNVCFDAIVPMLFHITERIRIYEEALKGNISQLKDEYRKEFGPFIDYPYSRDYRCQKLYPQGYKPPSGKRERSLSPLVNVDRTPNAKMSMSKKDPHHFRSREPSPRLLTADSGNGRPEPTTI